MKITPSIIDNNFGIGCTEANLDHVVIDVQPFDDAVRDAIRASKTGGLRLNWVDASLPINVSMRDSGGSEIPWECGEVVFRLNSGKVTLLIFDEIGSSASFELGQADGLWPEICDSPEECHV